mmetsp:Transcript_8869/g.12631  ORF Transcript_8869/g.12631 Transcript_8869/m.12631 type:complete len:285 (-) Transcript_8869:132-986(-)|eukprot:CAMPEP_0184854982 /NCGR_PEP_ID=MMETSP0580-20130426/335_1 /TAXON_ID=1118495 /ORGANISM="Dactyliosolen fragilissimus" /LENGTH=284 /DNA_ID=CAMNT_0027349379 /DNA_START=26 /DNA_END=880 /DNA_ORIENTATION=+
MPQQTKSKPKKPKGRKPAHQNAFGFKHNPKSKLTAKILESPNVGVCRRCHEKIEWRKKYRKYKPLTQPSKCNLCSLRNVTSAYHTICFSCSWSEKARMKLFTHAEMGDDRKESSNGENDSSGTSNSLSSCCIDGEIVQRNNQEQAASQPIQVCAICAKEPALRDEDDNNQELNEEIESLEKKLGRKLKLRERKAVERKIEKRREDEKEVAKAERRAARMASSRQNEEEENGEEHSSTRQSESDDEDSNIQIDEEESEDEFLNAIGGAKNMVVGEEYRKKLLDQT